MAQSVLNSDKKDHLIWSASTGRFERILIFYAGLALAGIFYWRVFLVTGIILIPITLKRLLFSKIASELTIDDDNQLLTLKINGQLEEIPFENLGYAFNNQHMSFNELTIYKTYIGTRGQVVKSYLTDIIGMMYTTSWKKSQVVAIAEAFEKMPIIKFKPEHKDLPLWERFI